jgi:Protein of unknown function (DUF4231)
MENAIPMGPEAEIAELEKAAKRFLGDEVTTATWARWKNAALLATRDTEHSRAAFYTLRTVALVSAISVPSLVGLNLSGTGGSVVRWLTFTLSLITAIVTGVVTLYRLGDRWLMYRRLRDDLLVAGWTLVQNPDLSPAGNQQAWSQFIAATRNSVDWYNKTYEVTIIQAAQSNPETNDSKDRDRITARTPT